MPERKRRANPDAIRIRPSLLQSLGELKLPLNQRFPSPSEPDHIYFSYSAPGRKKAE